MMTNQLPFKLVRTQRYWPSCSLINYRQASDQSVVVAKESRTSLKVSKKPCKPPFMKSVFMGIFDREMLVYPELEKDKLGELKRRIEPVESYLKNNVDSKSIALLKMIPNEVLQSLKNLGLFGQMIPLEFGGGDQTATETAFISEVLAKDLNIALMVYSHNFLGVQSLLLYGSNQQKEKYLPGLASGEKVSSFCSSESVSGSDLLVHTTKIVPSDEDPNIYILNGKKKWVINGNCASLFIVTAKIDFKTHTGKSIPLIRILVVDRDSPGVTVTKPQEHLGLDASNICEVHFKDTPVHTDCFIGGETQGFEMFTNIVNSGRFIIGATTASLLRNLTQIVTDFIVSRKQFEKPLSECELVQYKLANIANCIYVLESMTYHTAAILDNYENPDCALELAIIKVFSFTEGRRCLDLLMELMGSRAYTDSEVIQKYFRDFRTMETFDGNTDVAKLFITLMGLQYAGVSLNETVSKLRFPYEFPSFVIKRIFTQRRQANDNPKLTLNLYEELHPSLMESANDLEYCVLRLQYAIAVLLSRYGADAVNQQVELMRLGDTAVKIYAMTAVLGRASRSYCIGLPNAESEMKYAVQICSEYKKVVRENINNIIDGLVVTGDVYSFKFGSNIIKHKGYFLEHPLERSF